jgi:hypothetical protein
MPVLTDRFLGSLKAATRRRSKGIGAGDAADGKRKKALVELDERELR